MQALLLALFALVAIAAAEYKSTDDVKILTEANFDDIIADNDFVLAEFYAPWCGHCKSLEPEYKKAATELKAAGIVLGAVDATVESSLGSRFGVQGYPTLKFFKNGAPIDYTGGRTADTIVSWLKKRTGPAAKVLAADEVAAFAASAKVVVVGFFPSNTDANFKNFETVASANDEIIFGVSFDAAAAAANELSGSTGVVLFKQFDEGKNVLNADNLTADLIKEFVETHSLPLVIPFTMEVAGKIFQSPIGAIALLFTDDEDVAEFSAIAEKYRGKFVFTTSDSSFDRLNSYIGITPEQFPKFYILKTANQLLKYPLENSVDAKDIAAHIDSFLSGDLKPAFKSDPIPATNDGPVKIIVGKNFDSIVLDESKDVLLEIYAPWCGHCKKLEPIWDELGAAFKDNSNVVIAKMDGTGNEVDGINIRGFPTLQWYPAGKKSTASAVSYDGDRSYQALHDYIVKNSQASTGNAKDEL